MATRKVMSKDERMEIILYGANMYLRKHGFDSYEHALRHARQVLDGAFAYEPDLYIDLNEVEDFYYEHDIQYWES